jgi:hypothetical protein
LLLLLVAPLLSGQEDIVLDGRDGWRALSESRNIEIERGFRGRPELRLGDRAYMADEDTDLLLSFEPSTGGVQDRAGNYRVLAAPQRVTARARVGRGSAGFDAQGERALVLEPGANALFAPGATPRDFSLEFWLYPVGSGDGAEVLRWEGVLGDFDTGRPQSFRVLLQDRRLIWTFENLFQGPNAERSRIELAGRDLLVPREWQHHLLRYRADIGLLEYLVDGRVQDVTHATATGREGGDGYLPLIGSRSPRRVTIGGELDGFMDELRISRRFVDNPNLNPDTPDPGFAVLGPIDLEQAGSLVNGISAQVEEPGRSEVRLFYRTANTNTVPTAMGLSDLPWRPLPVPEGRRADLGNAAGGAAVDDGDAGDAEAESGDRGGSLRPPVEARYLWLRAELYPGEPGDVSPRVRRFAVNYTPNEPPPAPRGVRAEAEDGAVSVSWSPVRGDDVRGYLVYYGRASGEYLGTESDRGPSPIDVGDQTQLRIGGLANGVLYYFVVAAYDQSTRDLLFSREVLARPTRVR